MSPRAAWRLVEMGFNDVSDYVGSKMDWIDAGLPFEGTLAGETTLARLADPAVPTCGLDERTDGVRARLGRWPLAVVVNDARVVLGVLRAAGAEPGRAVSEVMREGPSTYRPHVTAAELAPKLRRETTVVVTTLDGKLVGVVRSAAIRQAAGEIARH